VDERVRDDVAVRVASESAWVLDRDAAEHESHIVHERMRVVAQTDTELAHRSEANASGREARSSIPSVASGGVCWIRPHGPRLTWIATIPAEAAGSTSLSTRSPT